MNVCITFWCSRVFLNQAWGADLQKAADMADILICLCYLSQGGANFQVMHAGGTGTVSTVLSGLCYQYCDRCRMLVKKSYKVTLDQDINITLKKYLFQFFSLNIISQNNMFGGSIYTILDIFVIISKHDDIPIKNISCKVYSFTWLFNTRKYIYC